MTGLLVSSRHKPAHRLHLWSVRLSNIDKTCRGMQVHVLPLMFAAYTVEPSKPSPKLRPGSNFPWLAMARLAGSATQSLDSCDTFNTCQPASLPGL